ncbi:MAG TPA: TrmH family RNA methyltransferase [Candidatus Eisenbacteria bacterium]|nr:TrmH family RNA methyltransferase [Candidatus Eisenbacteria bacterium]
MIKLGAKELRTTSSTEDDKKNLKKNPMYIICDNILDTYNTGSIFRLADAVAAKKVYLCGITETPPNTRIKKASINTTEWVEWEYSSSTVEAIEKLRKQFAPRVILGSETTPESNQGVDPGQARMTSSGIQIVAIEQNEKSVPFDKAEYAFPIAFIVSNETTGASQEVLDAADTIVEMPMFGVNKSLNVMVSLGIVLFQAIQKLK